MIDSSWVSTLLFSGMIFTVLLTPSHTVTDDKNNILAHFVSAQRARHLVDDAFAVEHTFRVVPAFDWELWHAIAGSSSLVGVCVFLTVSHLGLIVRLDRQLLSSRATSLQEVGISRTS